MGVVATLLAFAGVLFVLILVHELGHFISAKRAGITVQEFGIGFPPRIASVTWHGTRYSVNWIPLGGFVKMLGEDGDLELRRMQERGASPAEIEAALAGAFNRKPIWVRVLVLAAGVGMNFLLAMVMFSAYASFPTEVQSGPLVVEEVTPDSPAARIGLARDDVIVAADGRSFPLSRDLTAYINSRAGSEVKLSVDRAGTTLELTVIPRRPEDTPSGQGPIGFTWRPRDGTIVDPEFRPPGVLGALGQGVAFTWAVASQIPSGMALAVGGLLGVVPDAPDAAGPIGIAQETGRVLGLAVPIQLAWIGLLSTNLAVLNILPFPPLDGGRIMVVLLEAVRRRRLQAEREALIYLTGFAVLLALIILVSIRDIGRLFGA
ncbi:MAG: RIP metalloprotease [Candidatus Limnocylindria bacterium]